jgi:hypothetical protein
MKALLIVVTIFSTMVFTEPDELTGRWESKPSAKGNVTRVVFKADQGFEGYINKKPFTTGKYTLKNNIFSFTDNGCNNVKGVYNIIFFSYNDSIRFVPIDDSCVERRAGMSKLVLGRVKQ